MANSPQKYRVTISLCWPPHQSVRHALIGPMDPPKKKKEDKKAERDSVRDQDRNRVMKLLLTQCTCASYGIFIRSLSLVHLAIMLPNQVLGYLVIELIENWYQLMCDGQASLIWGFPILPILSSYGEIFF